MRPRQPDTATLLRHAEAFTQQFPVGTQVKCYRFTDKRGGHQLTKIRSEAWVMGGHSVMVLCDGMSGGQSVECITAP